MIYLISMTKSIDLSTDLFQSSSRPTADPYFVNRTDYKLILPRVINVNKVMRIFALCNLDDCKITFLFQCLKFAYTNETRRLADIFDLAVFRRYLVQNQSELVLFDLPNLEPNLERCFKGDLNQQLNQLALEASIQFSNSLNVVNQNIVKHRFDLTLSSFAHVMIVTDLPVYTDEQLIKFTILPFNLNFEPFTQTVFVRLLTPNRLVTRKWTLNYFSNDQLNRFEHKLSNSPMNGLWAIEVIVLSQVFRRSFFVLNHGKKTNK